MGGRWRGWRGKERVGGRGGEMTQTLYAHMRKRNNKKEKEKDSVET
jgi:hypothetical protein